MAALPWEKTLAALPREKKVATLNFFGRFVVLPLDGCNGERKMPRLVKNLKRIVRVRVKVKNRIMALVDVEVEL